MQIRWRNYLSFIKKFDFSVFVFNFIHLFRVNLCPLCGPLVWLLYGKCLVYFALLVTCLENKKYCFGHVILYWK